MFAGLDSDVSLSSLEDGVDENVDDWDDDFQNKRIKFKHYLTYDKAWTSIQK